MTGHMPKMAKPKLQLGKGAIVSILGKMLHPSAALWTKYPNMEKGYIVEGLAVLRQEVKKIWNQEHLSIVMRHDDFKDGDDNYLEL